jgi:hypothetical protein
MELRRESAVDGGGWRANAARRCMFATVAGVLAALSKTISPPWRSDVLGLEMERRSALLRRSFASSWKVSLPASFCARASAISRARCASCRPRPRTRSSLPPGVADAAEVAVARAPPAKLSAAMVRSWCFFWSALRGASSGVRSAVDANANDRNDREETKITTVLARIL